MRYFAIRPTDSADGFIVAIASASLQVDELSATNLLLPASVTATTTESGFPATNITDEDDATYWRNTGVASAQRVAFDLGEYVLDTLTFFSLTGNDVDETYSPTVFDLEVSYATGDVNNHAEWETVASFSGLTWALGETKTFAIEIAVPVIEMDALLPEMYLEGDGDLVPDIRAELPIPALEMLTRVESKAGILLSAMLPRIGFTAGIAEPIQARANLPALEASIAITAGDDVSSSNTVVVSESLPLFGMSATMTGVEPDTDGGALTMSAFLPTMGFEAWATTPTIARMAASLPEMVFDAAIVPPETIRMAQSVPSLLMTANAESSPVLTMSVSLGLHTLEGVAVAEDDKALSLNKPLPALSMAGSITRQGELSASVELPAFKFEGAGDAVSEFSMAETLPMLKMAATLTEPDTLTLSQALPVLSMAGSLEAERSIAVDMTMPPLAMNASLYAGNSLFVNKDLPKLSVSAQMFVNDGVSLSVHLPPLQMAATAFTGMALDAAVPALKFEGVLSASPEFVMAKALPLLVADMRINTGLQVDARLPALQATISMVASDTVEANFSQWVPMLKMKATMIEAVPLAMAVDMPVIQMRGLQRDDWLSMDALLPELEMQGCTPCANRSKFL